MSTELKRDSDRSLQDSYARAAPGSVGGGADWAASGSRLTKADDTHYTGAVTSTSPTTLSCKYVLGATGSDVEKSTSCADVSNRSMSVNGGAENDTVLNWAGHSGC